MSKQKVVARKQLPAYPPVSLTLAIGLTLDRLHAPGWVWGAIGVYVVLVWIGWIVCFLFRDDPTELKELQ
jgi:hypothetical protein